MKKDPTFTQVGSRVEITVYDDEGEGEERIYAVADPVEDTVTKSNPNHYPKGSAKGGQFAPKKGGVNPGAVPSKISYQKLSKDLETPDGGFSINAKTGKPVSSGYAVAVSNDLSRVLDIKDATPEAIRQYQADMAVHLSKPNMLLGGWHDPESHKVFLDVSERFLSEKKAAQVAKERDQKAYFNFYTFSSVNVGGTGGV